MDGSMHMMNGCMTIGVIFALVLVTTAVIQTVIQIQILKKLKKK
mgnify:CR=1 FL=1